MNEQTPPRKGLSAPALPNKTSFIPLKACTNLEQAFSSQEFMERIQASVPQHVQPGRMLRTFVSAVSRTPLLAKASVRSFVGACLTASQVGLEPNTPLGHLWLIPFKLKRYNPETRKRDLESVEINVIFGYPGLLDLSFRSSLVRAVHADVVWPGDEFSYEYGTDAHVRHRPKGMARSDTAQPDYAYMHAVLRDGQAFEVMPYSEVLRIRNRSQAFRAALAAKEEAESKNWQRLPPTWTEAPWVAHETAMARKTAFRAGSKWLPRSVELASAIALDEAADRRRKIDFGSVLDAPTIDGTPDYLGAAVDASQGDDEPDGPGEDNRGAAFTDRRVAETPEDKTPQDKPPATRRRPEADPPKTTVTPPPAQGAGFEALLLDERGDLVREEAYFDPVGFAAAAAEFVRHLSGEDAEAFLHYNADAIAEAREQSERAAEILAAAEAELTATEGDGAPGEDAPPETIQPPTDRGRLHWIGYVRMLKERLPSVKPAGLLAWIEAQREHLQEAPNAQFLVALRAINDVAGTAGVALPSWMSERLKPKPVTPPAAELPPEAPKPDADELWVERQLSELARISSMPNAQDAHTAAIAHARSQAVQHVMARLRRDKPALFQRADRAFSDTVASLAARTNREASEGPPPDDPDDPGPEAA